MRRLDICKCLSPGGRDAHRRCAERGPTCVELNGVTPPSLTLAALGPSLRRGERMKVCCYSPRRRRRSSILRLRERAASLPERRSRYETTGPDVRHQARMPVPRRARPRFVILRVSERRRHEAMNTGPVEAYAGLRRRYTRTPAITNATAARPPPSQPIGTFGLAPSSPRAAIATGTRVEDVDRKSVV